MQSCDDPIAPKYDEPWVLHAVPGTIKGRDTFVPNQCDLYELAQPNNDSVHIGSSNECPAEWFSTKIATCESWVFDENERTIVNDVSI